MEMSETFLDLLSLLELCYFAVQTQVNVNPNLVCTAFRLWKLPKKIRSSFGRHPFFWQEEDWPGTLLTVVLVHFFRLSLLKGYQLIGVIRRFHFVLRNWIYYPNPWNDELIKRVAEWKFIQNDIFSPDEWASLPIWCTLWIVGMCTFQIIFYVPLFQQKKCANGSTNLVFRQLTKCNFNEARILVDFFFNYMHIILSTNKKNSLSMCIASRCHFGKRQKENKME